MLERTFLAVVGLLYAGLAIWCTVSPDKTSATVGLAPQGASGRSEFMTVYGGLEMGLALVFLAPLEWPQYARPALLACLAIHACLVGFRTASFVMFSGVATPTYKLAAGEWIILLAAAAVWWKTK